eukprot:55997_1
MELDHSSSAKGKSISRAQRGRHKRKRDLKAERSERMMKMRNQSHQHREPDHEPQHKKAKSMVSAITAIDMSNVSIPEDFPMISIECTSADSNTNSHQEPTAEWNQACTDIIFGGSSLLLPSLKQQYDEQHDLCVHNVVSSNPIQHLYHKQNVINKQKNKIMILSKQKHQMNKEIESKDIEMSQIQTKHTQVISKKDITLFINKCIERDDNINFLKHIYHQIGVHLQERDKWTQPTKWFGSSTRTLQRHVSEVLDFIVQKANKFRSVVCY